MLGRGKSTKNAQSQKIGGGHGPLGPSSYLGAEECSPGVVQELFLNFALDVNKFTEVPDMLKSNRFIRFRFLRREDTLHENIAMIWDVLYSSLLLNKNSFVLQN